jgi:putative hydrolase of the HAD superfamily
MSAAPALQSFAHVTDWVFDLDNTLYPRTCNLFAQIDALITQYVMDTMRLPYAKARRLQKDYYRDHGTTLNGLMNLHGVDPDHFLSIVHKIDYSPVSAAPELVDAIRALPGRKFIFTNADVGHAESVLARIGGAGLFDGIYDIRGMGYRPKPLREAYDGLLAAHGIEGGRAAMFDDLEKNLVVPHETGWRTVQVIAGDDFAHDQVESWELEKTGGAHVHHMTADLAGFLRALP